MERLRGAELPQHYADAFTRPKEGQTDRSFAASHPTRQERLRSGVCSARWRSRRSCSSTNGEYIPKVVDERVAAALSRLLDSPLRVVLHKVDRPAGHALVNLTALARQMQASLDGLVSATADQLGIEMSSEDGGLRIVWHARQRLPQEAGEPVIEYTARAS